MPTAMEGLAKCLTRPAPAAVSARVIRPVNDEAVYLLGIAGWMYDDVEAWALKLLGAPTADNRVQATLMAAVLVDEGTR